MTKWFGKGCTHQCCKWEDNEISGGPDYQESMPVLIHCGHDCNPEESEGNCRKEICPGITLKKLDELYHVDAPLRPNTLLMSESLAKDLGLDIKDLETMAKMAKDTLKPSTGPETEIIYEARMPKPEVDQEYPVVVKKYRDAEGRRCTKFIAICMSAEKNEEDAKLIAKALNEYQKRNN